MEHKNMQLLQEVIKDRLELALNADPYCDDYNSIVYNEAMKAVDKQNEIDKLWTDLEKTKLDNETKIQIERDKNDLEKERMNLDNETKRLVEENKIKLERERMNLENDSKKEIELERIKLERERMILENETKKEIELERIRIENEKIELESKKNCDNCKVEREKIKSDAILKVVEVSATVFVAPILENKFRNAFAKLICNFEKDYNFTTTAGRSLSSLFKFK